MGNTEATLTRDAPARRIQWTAKAAPNHWPYYEHRTLAEIDDAAIAYLRTRVGKGSKRRLMNFLHEIGR